MLVILLSSESHGKRSNPCPSRPLWALPMQNGWSHKICRLRGQEVGFFPFQDSWYCLNGEPSIFLEGSQSGHLCLIMKWRLGCVGGALLSRVQLCLKAKEKSRLKEPGKRCHINYWEFIRESVEAEHPWRTQLLWASCSDINKWSHGALPWESMQAAIRESGVLWYTLKFKYKILIDWKAWTRMQKRLILTKMQVENAYLEPSLW